MITQSVLENMLIKAAELGAKKALESAGLTKPFISLRQAHKLYGRGVVDGWIKSGALKVSQDTVGKKMRLSVVEINALAEAVNIASHISRKK